jgi:hypothetical protein
MQQVDADHAIAAAGEHHVTNSGAATCTNTRAPNFHLCGHA